MSAPLPQRASDSASPDRASELRGDFGPVLASLVGLAFSIGSLGFTYSIGPFIQPLVDEFGWSRQQILGVQPLITLGVVVASVVLGWTADRRGVRQFILGSQLLFGLGFFGLALGLDSIGSYYLLYFLLAVGGGATTSVGFSRLLAQRYDRQRGLALGIANTGPGLCGFLTPPYATWAIQEFGWRGAYVALGLLPLCLALPLAWRYLHDDVPKPGAAPAARIPAARDAASVAVAGDPVPGLTFLQALRGRQFWLMSVGLFACSGVMAALIPSLVPLMREQGSSAATAAFVASGFGVAVIVGRLVVGALVDRYWGPLVGALLMFPAALAVAALAVWHPGPGMALAAVFCAGLAAGAEVDLMSYLASRYFGLREFARIQAALYVSFALGPGLLLPLFGWARDVTGSYDLGLYGAAAGIALFGALWRMRGR